MAGIDNHYDDAFQTMQFLPYDPKFLNKSPHQLKNQTVIAESEFPAQASQYSLKSSFNLQTMHVAAFWFPQISQLDTALETADTLDERQSPIKETSEMCLVSQVTAPEAQFAEGHRRYKRPNFPQLFRRMLQSLQIQPVTPSVLQGPLAKTFHLSLSLETIQLLMHVTVSQVLEVQQTAIALQTVWTSWFEQLLSREVSFKDSGSIRVIQAFFSTVNAKAKAKTNDSRRILLIFIESFVKIIITQFISSCIHHLNFKLSNFRKDFR